MKEDELFTYSRILIPKLSAFVWSDVNYDCDITLSNNQCRLILQMLAHPERNMSELGMGSSIKKSTMTGIVHTLESEKVLRRYTDKNDKRKTTLELTDMGNDIGYALRKKNRKNFIAKKNTLGDEDKKDLEFCIKNLNRIMDKLKEKNNAKN